MEMLSFSKKHGLNVGRGEEEGVSQHHLPLIVGSSVGTTPWMHLIRNLPAWKPGVLQVTFLMMKGREWMKLILKYVLFSTLHQSIIIPTWELSENYYDGILHCFWY